MSATNVFRCRLALLCSVLLSLAATGGPPSALAAPLVEVPVTACGQSVTGQRGYLTANLDCTGVIANGVELNNAELDLRGFTISGGFANGVLCRGKCAVFSTLPGATITGMEQNGIQGGFENDAATTSLTVKDVTISNVGRIDSFQPGAHGGNAGVKGDTIYVSIFLERVVISGVTGQGVNGLAKRVSITDSQIVNNYSRGVDFGRNTGVKILNSTLSGNGGCGVTAPKVSITDSVVSANGLVNDPQRHPGDPFNAGVCGYSVKISGCTITGNSRGAQCRQGKCGVQESDVSNNATGVVATAGSIAVKASTVVDNGTGLSGSRSRIKIGASEISNNDTAVVSSGGKVLVAESLFRDNRYSGIRAFDLGDDDGSIRVKSSLFIDNGLDVACGVSETCADLLSDSLPSFEYVAGVNECVHSGGSTEGGPGGPWGVCLLDCRNGTVNPGEICDESGDTATCDDDCTLPACQDGNLNTRANEQCDDGNASDNDGCSGSCIIEFCGDGIHQSGIGESCDSGAVDTASCDMDCTAVVCGDGHRNKPAGEGCDDGNIAAGDGCSPTCQKE